MELLGKSSSMSTCTLPGTLFQNAVVLADSYKNLTTVFPEFYCTILSRIGTVGMETSVSNMIIITKV